MMHIKSATGLIVGTMFLCPAIGEAAPPLQNPPLASSISASNAWLEIDTVAFAQNLRTLRRQLAGASEFCAVLKADAYGHGLSLLMPVVIAEGVNCIGLVSNQEMRVARNSGFTGRLMRLRTATAGEVETAMPDHVEELLGNLQLAEKMDDMAKRQGRRLKVHLALNAGGMSRNGLEVATAQGQSDALAIAALPGLEIVGVMTHFPNESRSDVLAGLRRFNLQAEQLVARAGLDRAQLVFHAANSFATLEVAESRLDMVRPGGLLFGDVPDGYPEYRRVMQFKSRVAAVNAFPKGDTVGYNRMYTLGRDSLLANIPVGYSDGYSASLSNRAHVLIRGHRVPVLGRVSMNTIMVDVTEIAGVAADDEVVLYGQQETAEITQKELEDIHGTLLADLYTVWGNSNPKFLK